MTFIYVTHDQEEALTMSDRIAVFNQGKIEQVGTPGRDVRASRHRVRRRLHRHLEHPRAGRANVHRPAREDPAVDGRDGDEGEPGTITAAVYLGPVTKFIVALDGGGELTVVQQNLETSSEDVHEMERKRVRLRWSPDVEFVIKEEKK